MNNLMPSIPMPHAVAMPRAIPMPKPIKMPSQPKIAHVTMSKPNGGGVVVKHQMTHGPAQKPFVFADPNKAMAHLSKIKAAQWRTPDQNIAQKTTHDLGLGPVA